MGSLAGQPADQGGQEWRELARQALDRDDYPTAARAGERALRLDDRSAELWDLLANAYIGLDRYDDAVFHARRAVQLEPDHLPYRYTLASCYELLGDWANARRCGEELARLDRDSPQPHLFLATMNVSKGDPGRALALLRQVSHRYQLSEAADPMGRLRAGHHTAHHTAHPAMGNNYLAETIVR